MRAIEFMFLQIRSKMHRLQNDSNCPKWPEIRICARLIVFARVCGIFAFVLRVFGSQDFAKHMLSIPHCQNVSKMMVHASTMHTNISINTGPPRKQIGAAVRKGKVNRNGWGVGETLWIAYFIFSTSYILLQQDFQAFESFFGFNQKKSNFGHQP